MKNTIKFAALGAVALAASSTAALADSQLLPGITTGIALGVPLPEGVYDISIAAVQQRTTTGGVEAAIPVWLIWSTPWQIAGGRISLDGTIAWVNVDSQIAAIDGFQNGLTQAAIKWNLGNGINFGQSVGVFWASDSSPVLADSKSRFIGHSDFAYIKGGWQVLANFIYGSGDTANGHADWFNYDLTVARAFGKLSVGVVAFGSTDLQDVAGVKQSQFAIGGLVGYDFGSFSASFKLTQDVSRDNYADNYKQTTAWLTIVKPLWSPEAEGPLK